jgi:hypothetical protein
MRASTALSVVCAAASLLGSSLTALGQGRWATYTDQRGTRVQYPADIFSVSKSEGEGSDGEIFTTRDGRARLHMYSMRNSKALSPAAFMRSEFPARRSSLTYDRVAQNFFAISTRRGSLIVYLRCNFSAVAGGTLHCVELRYPAAEKQAWDAVVTRVSRSVRPLP